MKPNDWRKLLWYRRAYKYLINRFSEDDRQFIIYGVQYTRLYNWLLSYDEEYKKVVQAIWDLKDYPVTASTKMEIYKRLEKCR
jgi:hypothetical protein